MADTFRVLIADPVHEDGRKTLAENLNIDVDVVTGLDEAGLITKVPGYDALMRSLEEHFRHTAYPRCWDRAQGDRAGRNRCRQY